METPVQIYWRKRIDNSRVVRQRDPAYWQETVALVGGAVVCLAIILLCAWQHFEFIHAGYQLEEMRAQYDQVLEWNRTLRLEQAALLDPMRIDLLARSRLGLTDPRADQLIPLGAGETAPAPVLARAPVPAPPQTPRPEKRASLAD